MGEIVQVPIVAGIRQKTEEHLSAQLVSMSNCRYLKTGSLSHRCGMKDLIPSAVSDTGTQLQQQKYCTQLGPELISIGGGALHSVKDRGYSADAYMYRGRYECIAVERRPVIYEQRQIVAWDMCSHNHNGVDTYATARITTELLGTTVYTKVALQFTTADGGTVIGPDLLAEDGTNALYFVRCVSLGDKLHVFWLDGTADELYGRSYDTSTETWGTKTTIHVTANGSRQFAVCTLGSHILVVCEGTTAGQTVVVTVVDSSLAYVTATLITETETLHGAFSIRATSGEAVWVVWGGGRVGVSNYLRYAVLDASTYGVNYGPDTVGENPDTDDEVTLYGVSSTRSSATSEIIVWDRGYNGVIPWDSGRAVQYQEVTSSGGTTFTPPVTHWFQRALSSVWSRVDAAGDPHYYVVLSNANSVAPTAVVCELAMSGAALQAQQVAIVAPRQVGFTQYTSTASIFEYAVSSVVFDNDSAAFVLPIATDSFSYDIYNKSFRVGLDTVVLTYDDQPSGEVFDKSLALVGGIPSVYGGQAVREIVPLHEPPAALAPIDLGTPSGVPSTTRVFQVRFTYQWRGDDGRIYESAPSEVRTITLTDSSYSHPPYCDVPCLHMTGSERPPYDKQVTRIVAYRTAANGSVFYRASWVDYDPAIGASWALSNPNYPVARIVLGTSTGPDDGDLTSQPTLYTEGGVLSNSPPPNATIVLAHAGRLWLAGTEDDRVWLSKLIVPEAGPGFNPSLTLDPFEGGRVRAMGSLDDKLVIFKERSIFVIFGEGPDDRGVGSTLTDPQLVSSDVGCTNPRSVAVTSMGLVFQATDGVPYLLTRQLQVVPIGKAIEDDFDGLTVSAAVLVQDTSELHLYCHESDKRFVLDLYHSAPDNPVWSMDTLSFPSSAACLYNGLSTYVCSDSSGEKPHLAFQEERAVHFDRTYGSGFGNFVPMSFKTGWIGAKAGWIRVKKVGLMLRRHDDHKATISISRDYDVSTSVDFDFTEAETLNLAAGAPYLICDPPVQKVGAVQVTFAADHDYVVDDGAGSTVEGVVLEVESKPGVYRQPKGLRK